MRPAKAARQRGFGDHAQRSGGGIGGFVDMKIEIPALAFGEREQPVEGALKLRDHIGHRADHAGPVEVDHRLDVGHMGLVQRQVDSEQRNGL